MQNRSVVSLEVLSAGEMFYDINDNMCMLLSENILGKPEHVTCVYLSTGGLFSASSTLKVRYCSIKFK